MATLTLYADKGSALTFAEVDGNFVALNLELATKVDQTRTITVSGYLTGGGGLDDDLTIELTTAAVEALDAVAAASPDPLADRLVKRDSCGNFSARVITANQVIAYEFVGDLTGLADRAAVLDPGASINDVPFTGSGDITIRAAPSHSVYKTVYVSPEGDNGSSGRNEDRAVASIEKALEIIEDQGDPVNWTVKLLGGVPTPGEIPVPDFTTIVGENFQRQNTITPTAGNEERNVFLCGNRVHLVNLKFNGWRHDDFDHPTKGFAMAFRPGAVILPGGVPYGQNCVVGSALTQVPTPLPNDYENRNPAQPIGMGCVIADGAVLSGYTVFPNIMTWGFTPAAANGVGYVARNRAHINCVNAIGVGAHIHFMAMDGGNLVLSGCSSQFGDYSLWSEGATTRTVPLRVASSAIASAAGAQAAIAAAKTAILTNVLAYIAGLRNWSTEQTALYTKDTGLVIDAIGVCVEYGVEQPMINVADGFFRFDGVAVFPYTQLPDWKLSFERLRERILAETAFSGAVDGFINALFARLVATLDNYFFEVGDGPAPTPVEPVRKRLRSLITAIGHQWTAPLSGTEFFRVPPQRVSAAIRRSIKRLDGGQVRFSGQDDRGNAVFVGGLEIDARSGELGGPPFDVAVNTRAADIAIASSF